MTAGTAPSGAGAPPRGVSRAVSSSLRTRSSSASSASFARLRPQGLEDPFRGRDADVGQDEGLFELVQDLVAAAAALEEVPDPAEGIPGPGQFFPEASEHGLNILFFKRLIVNGGG